MPAGKDVIVQPGSGEPFEAGADVGSELTPVRSDGRKAVKGHLERGWVKHRLIRDLALGEKMATELAEQYGVSRTSISNFKKKYGMEIEDVRNNLADEYAGQWVATKMSRIAEYQNAAEKMANGHSPRNAEVLVTILKAVAEELGQLPARTQVSVNTQQVTYQVVGIDPEELT